MSIRFYLGLCVTISFVMFPPLRNGIAFAQDCSITAISGQNTAMTPNSSWVPERARIVEAGTSFRLVQSGQPIPGNLSFWALNAHMTPMKYPESFAELPQIPGKSAAHCQNTTAAWGHVGLQMFNDGRLLANWGGGGAGGGNADYGCGGSNSASIPWTQGTWYNYQIRRGSKVEVDGVPVSEPLWNWHGSISTIAGDMLFDRQIFGGEFIQPLNIVTFSEPIGQTTRDLETKAQWRDPWFKDIGGNLIPVRAVTVATAPSQCGHSHQVSESGMDLAKFTWLHEYGHNVSGQSVYASQLLPRV